MVNIHKAKTQPSRLVDEAAGGKPFIIAKAGKPMVKVPWTRRPEDRYGGSGFCAACFRYPMTLTPWAVLKSSGCSKLKSETAAGYASAAMGSS